MQQNSKFFKKPTKIINFDRYGVKTDKILGILGRKFVGNGHMYFWFSLGMRIPKIYSFKPGKSILKKLWTKNEKKSICKNV